MIDPCLLIVYLDIGNEDGPSFSCWLAPYKTPVPHLRVICDGMDKIISDKQFVGDDLLSLFLKYNIVDILEIHDWYDYINATEAADYEQHLNSLYDRVIVLDEPVTLITVIPHNKFPMKYLVPSTNPIRNNLDIFSTKDKKLEKQYMANMLKPYKVNANYYNILTSGNIFDSHLIIISDEMGEPIQF